MDLKSAKEVILEATAEKNWISRTTDYECIRIDGRDHREPELLEALEELYRDGILEQVPSSGQALTEIHYKRAEIMHPTGKASMTT